MKLAKARKSVAVVLLTSVATLVLADCAHRAWRWKSGKPWSAAALREDLEKSIDTTRRFVPRGPVSNAAPAELARAILLPYSGGETFPDTGGVLKYFRSEAEPSNFEVLVMGGSVAASIGEYFKSDLEKLFAGVDLAGRKLVVLNYAHASYKQPQQTGRLSYLFALGHVPEVVVEIDGFNEVALGYENGKTRVQPLYPSAPTWGALLQSFSTDPVLYASTVGRMFLRRERAIEVLATADRWNLYWSSLATVWVERRVRAEQRAFAELQVALQSLPASGDPSRDRQIRGPEYDRDDAAILATCVESWVQGSISMEALCKARGVRYVQMLQPTLHDPGSKIVSATEHALPLPAPEWIEGAQRGYPLLRERKKELVDRGIRFVDASLVFQDYEPTVYFDACHILRNGEVEWIARVKDALFAAMFEP